MKLHTTFRAGGRAELFLEIKTDYELQKLLTFFQESGTKYFVVGNGSNLLVSDNGYDGAILHIAEGFDNIAVADEKIIVGAGALLSRTASAALEHSLTGLEFASGIPGSVGGDECRRLRGGDEPGDKQGEGHHAGRRQGGI